MQRVNWLCRLAIPAAAISLAAIGAIATPARSAAGVAPGVVTSLTIAGYLEGVAATSADNAWAVGYSGDGKTLIIHWNGTRWSQVTSPKPVTGLLYAVTAVSTDNAWAVGWDVKGSLILHWNGTRWSVQASAPVVQGMLKEVVVRGNSVWAVGICFGAPPLILHKTGNRWYVVPTEVPAGGAALNGVVVTGDGTAWADGTYSPGNGKNFNGFRGVVLRWNGALWKSVSSPLQGANNVLYGMAAGPGNAIWAVGADWISSGAASTAVSMLWNGRTWRKVHTGPLPPTSSLNGVTFVPGGTAWAVGNDAEPPSTSENSKALILRWTGHAWTQVANPAHRAGSELAGVAATSAVNAWAVGDTLGNTLILHWNGKTWS